MLDFGTLESPNYRTIVLVTVTVAVVAVLVVVVVTLAGRPAAAPAAEVPEPEVFSIPLRDFAFPDETPRRFYTLVPAGEPWTEAEIERYWTDPAEIGGELLEEESRRLIGELFDSVP